MGFLPDSYEAPAGSNKYMKFKDGNNEFRVLGNSIVGMELWINKKPVRHLMSQPFTRDELEQADTNDDGSVRRPKHFWAFPVIDMVDSTVKVLEVTQKSVQDALRVYVEDSDWGDPKEYNVLVKRGGSGLETSYNVIAKPKKELSPDEKVSWEDVKKKGFDVKELFTSGDPFSPVTKKSDEINIDDIPFN